VLEKRLFLSILGASLLLLAIALLIPGGKPADTNPRLPWHIKLDASGTTKVFDLTLGQSTMGDALKIFGDDGKINIFVSPEKVTSIEAFFDHVVLSGLHADVILNLSLDPEKLNAMYLRGVRQSELDSGTKKVTISSADMATAENATIQQITYLPSANLESDVINKLFGKPDSIIKEESEVEHWLYPKMGLAIVLNPHGKEVFQYVKPARFAEVIKPLQEMKQPEK
jgi:hypothetical protein